MHRGVRRKPIFEDEMDHQVLLQIIKTSLSKYNCWLHAYCLMTNHVHLLLETGDIEIGKFMKYMSECYAIYYNHKYGYRGHVFESRYKSCLVKEDAYFLQTSRYIHLNPVKAQMADYPEDYLWSSYRTMIGIADDRGARMRKDHDRAEDSNDPPGNDRGRMSGSNKNIQYFRSASQWTCPDEIQTVPCPAS